MINIRSICFLLLLLGYGVTATAQNYFTISGVVKDADSKEPLIFASIGIQGRSIGTITNTEGEFDFHIPVEYQNSIFEINMLGYESYVARVSTVVREGNTEFYLYKSSRLLEEVVITDSLSGGDIFQIAVNRIEKNYPMEPFLMDGFYRDIKKVGGTYVALLEAAVKIYDRDYTTPRQKLRLREKVALIEIRKSLGYDNKFTSFFDQTNLLEDLLLHNNVRYRQFSDNEEFYYIFDRKQISFYNGKRVFLLTLKNSDQIKIYIDALTYAFVRIEYKLKAQDEVIDRKSGLVSKMNSLWKIIEFKEFSGKMFLSHIDLISEIHWIDPKTNELQFVTELQQQLLINKIRPNSAQKINSSEKMKSFGLQYQSANYNKQFWDNYNVIKETPLNKQIIEDLEREITLEKQFSKNK